MSIMIRSSALEISAHEEKTIWLESCHQGNGLKICLFQILALASYLFAMTLNLLPIHSFIIWLLYSNQLEKKNTPYYYANLKYSYMFLCAHMLF